MDWGSFVCWLGMAGQDHLPGAMSWAGHELASRQEACGSGRH
jgi:hypothetical protein